MTFLNALFLGLLQGITEFLPISSSGHLVLAEHFLNISLDESIMLSFDVILHAGTLLALILYFWKTWEKLILSFFTYFSNKTNKEDKTLLNILVIGTIPIIIVAPFTKDILENYLRNPLFVISFMGIVGVIFLLAEKFSPKTKSEKVSFKQGVIIGIFQVLALIPGVSRSGTTIATGMFQGVERHKSAEFSFLLGTIAILAATVYVSFDIFSSEAITLPLSQTLVGFFSSFISSILCVHFLLKFLKKHSLRVFAFYLIGISLLGFLFL